MHSRVCSPPSSLRLFCGFPLRRQLPPPTDRVQPTKPHLYSDEQAQTAPACQGRACGRMGRSAYADYFGYAPPRIHRTRHPQFHRPHRLHQDRGSNDFGVTSRTRRPRGSQRHSHPRHGRGQSREGDYRQLPRGADRDCGNGEQPRGSGSRHPQHAILP